MPRLLAHRLAAARDQRGERHRPPLLELIHAWQVRRALRRARVQTLLAFVAVVVGSVLFLLATDGG